MPRMPIALTDGDRAALSGDRGDAHRLAMRILVEMADVMGADRLIDITSAHIDGCLYHGRAGLDFAERLVAGGARVAVPSTLNVGYLDLLHPDLYRGDPATATEAKRQMNLYTQMGCRPTWTCAPYQLPERPAPGEHVAWAESNAIVFANSVLGAHEPLRRLPRHLRGDHGAGADRRPPSRRGAPRDADRPPRRDPGPAAWLGRSVPDPRPSARRWAPPSRRSWAYRRAPARTG